MALADSSNGDEESIITPLLAQKSLANSSSQVAIVGANVCPIESLDYEIFDNECFMQDWRSRGDFQIFQYLVMKWLSCFLIGLIMGLVGFFNNLAVENIAGKKFVVTSNMMLEGRYGMAFLVFSVSNLVLTLFASVITALICPQAAGSGIPEVKAYLNGVDAPGILSPRTLLVKIVGSISIVSSSMIVGKAGPMVHTGACVASLVGQGGFKIFGSTWRWLYLLKNDRDRRDLVTCGAAAGIAASFRAPVGGVLFAFEEMASWWRSALLWRSFFTTAVVAVVLRSLIDMCLNGLCGLFGKGGLIIFDTYSDFPTYHLEDLPPVLVLAFIGGILGSLYNFLLNKFLRIYNFIHEKGIIYKILLACTVSIFTSFLLFGLPWFASCQPCPSSAREICPTIGRSGNFKKFQCAPDHYNDLASLIFNTNDDAIKNLFSKDTDSEFQLSSMLTFFVTCFSLSILSYGTVAPVGLFVPVIVTGASYGRFVGMVVGPHTNLSHGFFAILGAASFLGGTMRTTVSLCVIMLELTNNLLLLPLIMLVLLISKTVADAFNSNIYNLIMKAKGFPYLEGHVEPYMRQLKVADVLTSPLQLLNGIEKVCNVVNVLRMTSHHGFPIIDEPPFSEFPILYGLVLRTHLIMLLKKKAFLSVPIPGSEIQDPCKLFSADDFAKMGSGYVERIEDVQLTDEEMEMFIDLHPFANPSPCTVLETTSLAKALEIFRETGLRHMLVIPKVPGRSPVVGVLTRHDFMPDYILSLHPMLEKSRWKRLRIKFHLKKKFF
ncbi:putative chloride channel-like protein CLC-g [Cucumis melo]|uniref:Chloride channel protein n=1 Tax=Cucumis melo TaxID=3656 RepID=A0A1S3C4Y8_CUCME|nr:putative chloride channel-like protein CLC-g [Cucumis melo]